LILEGQKPYPAFAIDRHWRIVASNRALPEIYEGVAPHLLQPPVNGLRLSLHPEGLAPRVANLAGWHEHVVAHLRRQIDLTADPVFFKDCGQSRWHRCACWKFERAEFRLRPSYIEFDC
jgi:hypothetical protein